MGDKGINTKLLISLIEAHPVLWDKSNELYNKDRESIQRAWLDISRKLKADYDELDVAFTKDVMRRWANVRDAYVKTMKPTRRRSDGSFVKSSRKYIYHNELQFLNQVYNFADTGTTEIEKIVVNQQENSEEFLTQVFATAEIENIILKQEDSDEDEESSESMPLSHFKALRHAKRMKTSTSEEVVNPLDTEKSTNRMQFFYSLMPYIEAFNDINFLEFQTELLKIVTNITKKQKREEQAGSSRR